MLKSPRQWSQALVARLRRRFLMREETEGVAFAIEQIFRLPSQEALRMAEAGAPLRWKLFRLCTSTAPERALRAVRQFETPLDLAPVEQELSRHASESYLLSLPMTVEAVVLLARLTRDTAREFLIINTPLTHAYLRPLVEGATNAKVSFASATEMVKHNRQRNEERAAQTAGAPALPVTPVTYVTFPDHQGTRGDTMWRVRFMDDEHEFSTIEPLLFYRGLSRHFTFRVETGANGEQLTLVAYQPAQTQTVTEADMRQVLEWLAREMETVMRQKPSTLLSWEHVQARSGRLMAQMTVMKLKTMEGYVRAWREADANVNAEAHVWAVEELRKIQENVYHSADAPRVAASN